MGQPLSQGKPALHSMFHLFYGRILSRAIGLVGGLLVIRLLAPEQYGLIAVALVLPGIVGLFSDPGVNSAVTKFSSEYLSKSQSRELRSLVLATIWSKVTIAFALALSSFYLAEMFADVVLGNLQLSILLRVSSWMILGRTLYEMSEGILVALGGAAKYAVLMISFEILGAILPVVLVLYGLGVLGVLIGGTIAIGFAGFVGTILVVRLLPTSTDLLAKKFELTGQIRKMLRFGLPLAGATLTMGALAQFYNFLLATNVPPEEIGNFTAAAQLAALVSYVNIPIITVLLPTFSKIDGIQFPELLTNAYRYSVKYSSLIVLPAAGVLIAGAPFLTSLLFGESYTTSSVYLSLLSAEWLAYGLGWPHLRRLFIAQGKTKWVATYDLLTVAVSATLALLLIRSYSTYGIIIPILFGGLPALVIGMRKAKREYGIASGLQMTGRLYASLGIAGVAGFAISGIPIIYPARLFLLIVGMVVVYFVCAPILGGITEGDVRTLRHLLKDQLIIGKLSQRPLDILHRLTKFRF